jgi:16S rRNA (guanine527-N7)-methyltransferase
VNPGPEAPAHVRPLTARLSESGFAKIANVPRETMARLEAYVGLLTVWNRRINLVGANTMGDVWRRHILDSAQLFPLLPDQTRVVADLGSGAGLPGLVLAILGVAEVHLIESDQRKAAFLREAKRVAMADNVTIHARRAEKMGPFKADAVVARAVAPLNQLLYIAEPFLAAHSRCLFLKGKAAETELTEARKTWRMTAETLPSRADPAGIVLLLGDVSRETVESGHGR